LHFAQIFFLDPDVQTCQCHVKALIPKPLTNLPFNICGEIKKRVGENISEEITYTYIHSVTLIFHSSALDFLLVVDEKMNGFVEPGVYVL
jgi:hypothetical protein